MDKSILYHGSTVVVEKPIVSIGRKDLDFGPGFYLTNLYDQASRWAKRIQMIRNADHAVINTYKYDEPVNCNVLKFDAYNREWLEFIVESRQGKQPWAGYDIVEGGVADDRVIDAIEAFINGYSTVETTLSLLIYHKLSPNATTMSINTRLNKLIGNRYFHSNASNWSIRRRGNVHLNQMMINDNATALATNHTTDGI